MKKSLYLLGLFNFISLSFCAQLDPIYIEGETQGTTYHINYYDSLNRDLSSEIIHLLTDFDQSVSTYNSSSIISRINRGEKNVIVDAYFTSCFKQAKEIWKNTKGTFDPTVYPLVNAWGFGPGKKESIEPQKIDSILKFVGFQKIKLKGNSVCKKDPRVSLDFNAFAQGYSVDLVSLLIESKGISSYLVEIGGEVYAKGKHPTNSPWLIGIEQPMDNKFTSNPYQRIIELNAIGAATSGNYRRYFIENGVKYAHHIDPKTGYPTKNNLLSASVFSRSCIVSDATATGLLVMGLNKSKAYLKKHSELDAILIYSDELGNYKIFETKGAKAISVKLEEN